MSLQDLKQSLSQSSYTLSANNTVKKKLELLGNIVERGFSDSDSLTTVLQHRLKSQPCDEARKAEMLFVRDSPIEGAFL